MKKFWMIAVLFLFVAAVGCKEKSPEEASKDALKEVKVPDKADAVVVEAVKLAKAGEFYKLMAFLPDSYQKEILDIFAEMAKIDPELYNKGAAILVKAIDLGIKEKDKLAEMGKEILDIFAEMAKIDPELYNKGAAILVKAIDLGIKEKDKLAELGKDLGIPAEMIVEALNVVKEAVEKGGLKDHEAFKKFSVVIFAKDYGKKLFDIASKHEKVKAGLAEVDVEKLGIKLEKEEGDKATVLIDGDSTKFVKVEGKWIPEDFKKEELTKAKEAIKKAVEEANKNKAEILKAMEEGEKALANIDARMAGGMLPMGRKHHMEEPPPAVEEAPAPAPEAAPAE